MRVYISSDHGGFDLKHKLLDSRIPGLVDMGPAALDPDDDYPQYAFPLAEAVAAEPESLGILICRSGNGMAIAANKVKGIRAALCFNTKHARMAREDDHANILVLDSDYQDLATHLAVVREFLASAPQPGRHARRIQQITDYESRNI